MAMSFLRLRAASFTRGVAAASRPRHITSSQYRAFTSKLRARAAAAANDEGTHAASEVPSSVDDVPVEEYATRPSSSTAPSSSSSPLPSPPPFVENLVGSTSDASGTDWSKSYHGLSSQPFSAEIAEMLQAPLDPDDVEMKPGVFVDTGSAVTFQYPLTFASQQMGSYTSQKSNTGGY